MKSVHQNAKKIRAGAKLLLMAAVVLGLAFIVQVIPAVLRIAMTYEQQAYLIYVTDSVVFAAFVAAGVGAYLAFAGIADELEAGA